MRAFLGLTDSTAGRPEIVGVSPEVLREARITPALLPDPDDGE